ncbi:MAG TPA: hypothetical protein VNZ52_15615 [Candidatus Thermoplasmatota archaeon]|nr:hypothetical protein [Candidatus Thermoplasmatota archaeon]
MKFKVPVSLLGWIALTLAAGAFVALAFLGIIPLDSLFLYILNNVLGFVAVALLAAVGGVFLGMLLAHRALATREFSPVERAMMETSQEVKRLTARIEELEAKVLARVDESMEQREKVRR